MNESHDNGVPHEPRRQDGPGQWKVSPEFRRWMEAGFPADGAVSGDEVSRRRFMKMMSASFLLAGFGLTGCRRPEERFAPHAKQPEGYVPGVARHYATARPVRGTAVPLLVKTLEGRPVKIEGHPADGGGTDAFTQASLLSLYDPGRAARFTRDGRTAAREEALDFLAQTANRAAFNGGEGLCFLMGESRSPSRRRLQQIILSRFPKTRWFIHEPVDFGIHRRTASTAFGRALTPEFRFDRAARIVSLDCDFLGTEEEAWRHIGQFAQGRNPESPDRPMSRLYAVEGLLTLTGANADHRLLLPPGQVTAAAARLMTEILREQAGPEAEKLASAFRGDSRWIAGCANDLLAPEHRGASLVVAGHRQPPAVHLIAHAVNAFLGNTGRTVLFRPDEPGGEGSIHDLAVLLNEGRVETLVLLGVNPAYDAPADLDWAKAQAKAKTVIRLGAHEDETFPLCTWHLPEAHYLETWGDARAADGTLLAMQPMIEPLFGGVGELEVLSLIAGQLGIPARDIVRETFLAVAAPDDPERDWRRFLHDGRWPACAVKPVEVRADMETVRRGLAGAAVPPPPSPSSLEAVFCRDAKTDDGRFHNNGWLRESPDPVTKLTWENAMLVSPETARHWGFEVRRENGRLLAPTAVLTLDGRRITGPVLVQPGQADNTVALALGYGRSAPDRTEEDGGFNAGTVRTSRHPWIAPGAVLVPAGGFHPLALTQEHGSLEGCGAVVETDLESFRRNPASAVPAARPAAPLYPNPLDAQKPDALHQWGMVVDLNACTGCNACALACQSENNIPVVGKEQVALGREMHWLRVDRYFEDGKPDGLRMVWQPMFCQHCEAAPCENVCPFNATVHNEEGLNEMVYNRCAGARFCSNNCPYKVRRFNFFDYHRRTLQRLSGDAGAAMPAKKDDAWDLLKLLHNPEVTVRMRGVMEKCTFCVHRIEQARTAAKIKAGASGGIRLKESEGTIPRTACQQACPAGAIVFGDLSDPESRVSRLKASPRNYAVLGHLGTGPRVTYLAKVRNLNPAPA